MDTQASPIPGVAASTKRKARGAFLDELTRNYDLLLMLCPGFFYFLIFSYIPMFGLLIAFKDYNIFKGVFASEWNNFQYFKDMLMLPDFFKIVRNTLTLNIMGLLIGFPTPIILALLLNEVRNKYFKRISQSLLYLPHFMSWIVLGGIVYALLSPQYGVINQILKYFGLEPIYFMASKGWWITTYIGSGIWQEVGWGTIIYLAAITTVDPHLYEAAIMDGAGRFRKIVHITIPAILPTVVVLLILNVGHMVSIGFEKPMALMNPLVTDVADVISTYMYQVGIQGGQFGLTTAVGMVQSVINLILIVGANYAARLTGREGIW
ncbi:putative aldouronate transport system permease protein [Paenibacillus sp. UNCCL117]|uniref:ABC transporter permease n=1 Tax=unclassified Paenibacillus TaxID=185978 RepID=UPI00088933CB|nr:MULTISPECIES: ABC transporter permease subunit [unclassified Paenibacillus]SDC52233.1 carbohydrate ABC transporter membrane protein 1, CUT1 family [Paenibacillus sp. cl123]SFW11341.1 putative aldouronate transport system permease protein [Paenibacillus sp. UNCCL117]